MIIESVELMNYRNYEKLRISLTKGTNIFYGDNAQGKTNILESVYLCCTAKSYKGAKDRDIIRFGEEEAHIKLLLSHDKIPCRLDAHLKKNRTRGIAVNGIPIRKASELFGIANVIFFSPEDLNIIKNGPAQRRRFIDMELCQLDKFYTHSLVSYNRALLQRNKALKELNYRPDYLETLDIWDAQLIRYAVEIIEAREKFIHGLNRLIRKIHYRLSGQKEDLTILYEPDTAGEYFEEAFKKNREQDIRQKTTLKGPHRDDIRFILNQTDIRRFGSQGQQRTAALSLKLAELELARSLSKDEPVLLLDDVLSELDGIRQKELLSAVENIQTLITCTGLEDFINSRIHIDNMFRIVDGTALSVPVSDY